MTTRPAVYQTREIAICGAIPSVRSVAGLLSIQRVVMLRPPLQELGFLSRQGLRPGEWMPHPRGVKQIWRVGPGGGFVCDSSDIALSPLVTSDSSSSTGARCYGTDLAKASSVRLSPIAPSMRKLYALNLRLRVRRPPA